MKRFKPAKQLPPGFSPAVLAACQQFLQQEGVEARLQWNEQEVFASFDGWWLSSSFFPQARLRDDRCQLLQYAARLRIFGQFGQALPANWLFAMNYAESKAVALLKLIRTLHLVNHLGRNGRHLPLRIDVDPRICHAYSDRIVDFTARLLEVLEFPARQAPLLLFLNDKTSELGLSLLRRYRQLGHRVGLGDFGECGEDLLRLWRLEPDFLSLAPRFMSRAIMYPQVRDRLLQLVPQLVEQGYALAVEDIVCQNMLGLAQQMGAEHLSGPLLSERLRRQKAAQLMDLNVINA
ncbi:EAL domain-containing protein [Chromobacterium subtsugae]|uniref:EAL domain-containing protein n=1 Tax=Chromobacterium subtsugae TaxID=251747 RepID=A0ABS7FMB6_9NEIS|nr:MULTISPECIES: EAL domain-containing protein [Chromobacterium]MBW7569256.1 EAL domain-containing protein [Chromobacterium subtsugae]MBW8290409.1 EAL domain-containing protein [Chromobacterium subtsugae]WSE90328.1 EAL domain-containing protein [Chromobacterium subtsugae]WVH58700.1 EAL domain-containing protein [Chromobacterium subtsugae]